MWIINPDIFPPGTHDTLFLPGCSSFTNYGGCWHPSGERIIRFHRQLRITCKCHLAEWFLHGSKDTLKLLTMIAKPCSSIQSQQTQKTLPTELAPVWCGSHSDIPSRLVDYLQFSFFSFLLMYMLYNHHQAWGKLESKASQNFPLSIQSQQETVNEYSLALWWHGYSFPSQ